MHAALPDRRSSLFFGQAFFPGRISARRLRFILCAGLAIVLTSASGCATRLNRHSIIDQRAVEIDLVTVRQGLFGTQKRDFEHPAIISFDRMKNILAAIEVETAEDGNRFLRQPAIHPELIDEAATALVQAFAESNPDSELGVKLIRKQAQLGIFHDKFLTSFLAHIKDNHLYLVFSEIEWRIPQSKESGKNKRNSKIPEPQPGGSDARFRIVSGEPLFYAGPKALEVDWRNDVFRKPFRLPGAAKGEERRREVLFQSKVPTAESLPQPAAGAAEEEGLGNLSPEQLRTLADLEEDRRAGKITETAYQRAKRDLLRKR